MAIRPADPPPEAWSAELAEFLAELAHTRRLSPLTVAAYARELLLLARALPAGPQSADPARLRRELAQAHARGLSGRTLARRLAAWRTFFAWRIRLGGHNGNPAHGLRPPRSARRLPNVLGIEAAARLVQAQPLATVVATSAANAGAHARAPGQSSARTQTAEAAGNIDLASDARAPAGDVESLLRCQDDAMFELLYSSGLRLAELVGLDRDRLDLAQGLVTVLGKGQRTRTIPVGAAACSALGRWLALRAVLARRAGLGADPGAAAVFLGRRGQRISPRTVQERLARRGRELGLPQRIHPHMLRHSCASHVLQSSADLRAVQELLGHASIASTQIYTHLDFQHLALAYDAAHPRARKGGTGDPK